MFDKKVFAERLLALRKEKKLIQAQSAEELEVSFHQVSKTERAQRAASIEVLTALANFFEVPMDCLTGRKGANLQKANLEGAIIQEVVACGADFSYANLSNADLRNADLRGAKITGAIFPGADLAGTILEGMIQ